MWPGGGRVREPVTTALITPIADRCQVPRQGPRHARATAALYAKGPGRQCHSPCHRRGHRASREGQAVVQGRRADSAAELGCNNRQSGPGACTPSPSPESQPHSAQEHGPAQSSPRGWKRACCCSVKHLPCARHTPEHRAHCLNLSATLDPSPANSICWHTDDQPSPDEGTRWGRPSSPPSALPENKARPLSFLDPSLAAALPGPSPSWCSPAYVTAGPSVPAGRQALLLNFQKLLGSGGAGGRHVVCL